MQQPKKMTILELRTAIAEAQGWTDINWDTRNDMLCGKPPSLSKAGVIGLRTSGWSIPNCTTQIDVAIELWRELPLNTSISSVDVEGMEVSVTLLHDDTCTVHFAPKGCEALAICLAWYQWKTGTLVQIKEPNLQQQTGNG